MVSDGSDSNALSHNFVQSNKLSKIAVDLVFLGPKEYDQLESYMKLRYENAFTVSNTNTKELSPTQKVINTVISGILTGASGIQIAKLIELQQVNFGQVWLEVIHLSTNNCCHV